MIFYGELPCVQGQKRMFRWALTEVGSGGSRASIFGFGKGGGGGRLAPQQLWSIVENDTADLEFSRKS